MADPIELPKTLRILMVEDNPNDVYLSRRWLQKADPEGFTVQDAATIADALRLLTEQTFDLAVLDLGLPDNVGLTGLHQLQQFAPELPVVVLTGNDDNALRAQAIVFGAQDYLVKGHFEPEYWLAHALRHAVERHRLQQHANIERARERGIKELCALDHLGQAAVPVTALLYGQQALSDYNPDLFQTLVKSYRNALEHAVERQVYKVEYAISRDLSALAEQLGFLKAGPRDVIDLHSQALEIALLESPRHAARFYTDEGRLIALELMGYLVSYYRRFYQDVPKFGTIGKKNHHQN